MIRREDVADLRAGDVVEITRTEWPAGSAVRGPLTASDGLGHALYILDGFFGVRELDGEPYDPSGTLTVVSRAPRPLYVNHDREKPVPRDVVLAPDGNGEMQVWICITYITGEYRPHFVKPERSGMSHALPNGDPESRMCQPYRLLVDGETGQVVP